jgi:hypothetical protein
MLYGIESYVANYVTALTRSRVCSENRAGETLRGKDSKIERVHAMVE